MSEEPEEQLPKENGQKAMDRADRRLRAESGRAGCL